MDQVLLACDNSELVILVTHAPDSVLRVVIHRQLSLAPERGSKLICAPTMPKNDPQHLVLDVRTQYEDVSREHDVRVLRMGIPAVGEGRVARRIVISSGPYLAQF